MSSTSFAKCFLCFWIFGISTCSNTRVEEEKKKHGITAALERQCNQPLLCGVQSPSILTHVQKPHPYKKHPLVSGASCARKAG